MDFYFNVLSHSHREYVKKNNNNTHTNVPKSPKVHSKTHIQIQNELHQHKPTHTHGHVVPSAASFPCVCPRWPAASSPSTGWRSTRGRCKTSVRPSCRPCTDKSRDRGWKKWVEKQKKKRFKIFFWIDWTQGGGRRFGLGARWKENGAGKYQIQQNVDANLFNS